jgi:PAS domain S-box-containing protein
MKNKNLNKRNTFTFSADLVNTGYKTCKNGDKTTKNNQRELCNKNERRNNFLKQIEIAKREWEKTMDCVGEMVILTDSEGTIKRVNKAVRKFTKKPFKEILGRTWEDLIIENNLQAMTLFAGCTELLHRPTGRWFELNAYPIEDIDVGFSGNVLTIRETTEVKLMTERLEMTKREIEESRNKLRSALLQICSLMQNVIQMKDHTVRFSNPYLKKCYKVKNCTTIDCPCYGREIMRCWQVAGTFCGGKVQGTFAQKFISCSECEVYRVATADPIYQIGEHFNNMMHVLENKHK